MKRFMTLLLAVCLLALCCAALSETAEIPGGADAPRQGGDVAPPASEEAGAIEDEAQPADAADGEDAGAPAADFPAEETAEKGLEVCYLDIGRVDAILIRCDGVCAFIDVGFKRDAEPTLAYLKKLGVEKLDYYIGSHAHADHVGGAAAIIGALKPDHILIPHRKVWSAILENANKSQEKICRSIGYDVVKHGDVFPLGGAVMKCLGPINIVNCGIGETRENENSMILRMTYGAHTFLFTGDTSDVALRAADKKYSGELRADVFKNPHHNGAHDDDIIRLVKPKVTVFCTDNISLPGRQYLRALKNAGSEVCITGSKNEGNVRVTSDGVKLRVLKGYALSALSLDPPGRTLAPGNKLKLTGTLAPKKKADLENWLYWESSDPKVAKVSRGTVTAVSEGVATITAMAINGLSDSVEVRVTAVGLTLNRSSLTLKVGDAFRLKAKPTSSEAKSLTGEWLSEDTSVAVVTDSGEVLAAGTGETRVIARLSNGAEAVCRVLVVEEPVKSVRLSKSKLSLSVGQQYQLSASVSPSDATDQRLEWASSDETVATVDSAGNVLAVGPGTAKVGVRAAGGAYDLCAVKVK